MPAKKELVTIRGLIGRILEPPPNIKDSTSRQQARLTTICSLILAIISFLVGIVGLIISFPPVLSIGLIVLAIIMSIACAFGHSDNFTVGSILLVSGIILGGFLISSTFPENTIVIIILMSTVVPAFILGIVLLPLVAIIIIAVIVLITIGVLPLMSSISPSTELLVFISLILIQGVVILIAWYRDTTEAFQLDEIGSLRGRLEEKIGERTRFSRITSEIAQELIVAKSMDTLLNDAVSMISARMGFSFSGFYLLEETGNQLLLRAAQGTEADRLVRAGKRIPFGTPSIIGWVAENKQQHLITRLSEDQFQLEAELLPGNQSELAVPIMSGDKLLGVLDVQSTRTTVFDNETIVVLEMLSGYIATAIQNVRLFEMEQGSIQEAIEVYLAGYKAAESKTENEIFQVIQELFLRVPYISALLLPEGEGLKVQARTKHQLADGQEWPESISVSIENLASILGSDIFIGEGNRLNSLPYNLVRFLQQSQIFSVALIPIDQKDIHIGILLIGNREREPLNTTSVQPYTNLAKQIAVAIDHIRELQKTQRRIVELGTINFQLQNVTELAKAIEKSSHLEEAFRATQELFVHTQTPAMLLVAEKDKFRIVSVSDPQNDDPTRKLPEWLDVSPDDLVSRIAKKTIVAEVTHLSSLSYAQFHPELNKFLESESNRLPVLNPPLLRILEQAHYHSVALIPVIRDEKLPTLLIVGSFEDQVIPPETIQACQSVAELITSSIERINSLQKIEHRVKEMEIIENVGHEISVIHDPDAIYSIIHTHVRQLLGNVNFLVAIYNSNTSSISIPYMFERGLEGSETKSIETFPLGEGLTSILIHTKEPLMIVEDTEKRAAALGAKITGQPAKSWLGTPLIVSGEAIGALIVQDTEHENVFNQNDLKIMTGLSTQVSGAIFNARLLEQMRSRAIQLQTAAEVARDISGSLDLGELLNKSVTLIRERFNFYHAAVFLLDAPSEFAVIREATGDAGTQMKRAGHKLKVGSKSIVGYVTGSGEPLIVNETTRDATYFANPLLPETRAEVAIPLKVGQRILGALDVQSSRAFSFGEEDLIILRILADQMAIAVINSELFADTQEHLSQHRLLHHVTTASASGTTLEESLNSATQGLQVTLGGDRVSILLADKGKKTLKVRAFAGYSEEVGNMEIPFGEGITGWVAVHQQPQRINDVTQDPRYIQVGSNIRSELAIPLSYRGDLLGVLNVESDQASAYNENDEELLGTLGGSLAAIISNARLIEQVRRQVDHERMLYEITSKIRRSTDVSTIMATTAGELTKVLGAQRAHIKMGIAASEVNSDGENKAESQIGDKV
jgi:GAF domain-containing protein